MLTSVYESKDALLRFDDVTYVTAVDSPSYLLGLRLPMGSSWSSCACCGRRGKPSAEKEPLLPRHNPDADGPTREELLTKSAAVFAAVSEGKAPSQDQINVFLKALQRNVLDVKNSLGLQNVSTTDDGYGPLSARGRLILDDLREGCQAILQFGVEKNCAFLQRSRIGVRLNWYLPIQMTMSCKNSGIIALK